MQILEIFEPGQTPLPHAEERELAVGIDLGTTNSLVAISQQTKPEVLRDAHGQGIVPSVVAYAADGAVLVGDAARMSLLDAPERVVSSIKRLMGRGPEDLKRLSGSLSYKLQPSEDGRMVRLDVSGRKLTPVEISADILRALKARAEGALGQSVGRAVITVPAYFDDAARTATRDAARLAGLEVLRLVNEPTAAALAYGLDKSAEGLYAIYDLGGGTFDVSLLRMEKGVFQVLATGGDAALGGDDFDHAIAEHWLAERADLGNADLSINDTKTLLAAARLAKECLSTQMDGSWQIEIEAKRTAHKLDRAKLEQLLKPLVDRTITIMRQVLADADIRPMDVQGIVLVGGSTRLPMVRRAVAEVFDRDPLTDINPDEVVALGAALQAEALTRGSDTLLLDVTPLSLGIETMGGLVEKVIPRNSPIPVARGQEFTTFQDGQTAMLVHVVQGERELVHQCRSLARFELQGIPPMVAGAARIRVTFAVDADGLLTVSAQEKTTEVEQRVEVKPSYGLTEDEMIAMLKDSMIHAREDMELRLLTEQRVEADRVLAALRAALVQDKDLLSPDEFKAINEQILTVETVKAGADRHAIHAAVETLDRVTQDFAGRRMDRGIGEALKGIEVETLSKRISAGE